MADLKPAQDYEHDFDADWFLKHSCSDVDSAEITYPNKTKFILDSLHDIFKPGKITGNKCLDIGSGPSVISVISASRHVNEIYVSDIVQGNRDHLQKWKDGEPMSPAILNYVLGKEGNWTSPEDRESLVRQKVSQVRLVDLRDDPLLPDSAGQFDVITAALCLGCVSSTNAEFTRVLKSAADLMTKGGHLVEIGAKDCSTYRVGGIEFTYHKLSKEDIFECYTAAGFKMVQWKVMSEDPTYKSSTGGRDMYAAVFEKL